jgi:hypothetical protein
MASSYLNRTNGSAATLNTKYTISVWLKRSDLQRGGSNKYGYIISYDAGGNARTHLRFGDSDDALTWYIRQGSTATALTTNRQFRDTSAFYHFLFAYDSTQGTASNRQKIYVNGTQETSFSSSGYVAQNIDSPLSTNGNTFKIASFGGTPYTGAYFGGYMSHFAFVDGQALTPTSFGETDSTSGIWKFKPPSSITWGNNGYHLKFEDSSNMGLDSSGQGNNFSVNGNLKQALDTPSNVHATFSPLHYGDTASSDSYGAFSNGNNTYASTQSGSPYPYTCSTLAASSGKWYAEFKILQTAGSSMVGITDGAKYPYLGDSGNKDACLFADGQFYPGNSSFGSAFTDNDICGVAMDLDNMKVYFHKNGVYQNSGVPTSGATGTGAANIPTGGLGQFHFAFGDSGGNTTSCSANFGNGFFGTTAITSAGSNGNGSLFEYDVPSGYYALNTKNLNTYG